MELAVIGREEFTLGFALTGIKHIFNVKNKIEETIKEIQNNDDIKIVIFDESLLQELNHHVREDITGSVSPVFVALSTNSASDNLRKMIQKSIGVDLWKEKE